MKDKAKQPITLSKLEWTIADLLFISLRDQGEEGFERTRQILESMWGKKMVARAAKEARRIFDQQGSK